MSLYEPKRKWRTLHYIDKDAVVDANEIVAFYEVEDGTLLMFSNGDELVVDEDIKEVKNVLTS